MKLFMVLLGSKPEGRYTEQHDVFFGIGESLKTLLPDMYAFWPEAKKRIHIDAWREVTNVDGHRVTVVSKEAVPANGAVKLFFINLGGYKPGEFEEYHYKMLVAAPGKGIAIRQSKETAFYRHTGFKGAESHIDDRYGIDVDDFYEIEDILPASVKDQYALTITKETGIPEDEWHLGYLKVEKLAEKA